MRPQVISLHYTLKNKAGEKLDSSEGQEPFAFMTGAKQIIAGLERAVVSMRAGEKKNVQVPAAEAYGICQPSLLLTVPREKLPGTALKVGDRFRGGDAEDDPIFRITQLTETEATLDANHPLAGVDLVFDVEIITIREATLEEIEHGHAHDGHSHGHGH